MVFRPLDCLFDPATAEQTEPVHAIWAVRPEEIAELGESLTGAQAALVRLADFKAGAGKVLLLPPGEDGRAVALLGLGKGTGSSVFGALPTALPKGSQWRLARGVTDGAAATLAFCLGAYRFGDLTAKPGGTALLENGFATEKVTAMARAIWMARDLVNTPANLLGPEELSQAAVTLAQHFAAKADIVAGEALALAYPTIAAVGAGSDRKPRVATLRWRGSRAGDDAPHVALCGKGVCFDSGGYDLKPSSSMLRMKKDMGGAAVMMAVAAVAMAEDLPIRLTLRLGCVENSVSGAAMRPMDVIRTRSGRTVEIGNTDAEGRLVLCDLLDEAAAEAPDILIDAATLTGAARSALGPELPALFCTDPDWTARLLAAGTAEEDALWQLPLWEGYDNWLDSRVADMNNVSTSPLAGAITAALFLKRFISDSTPWAHLDIYAWNDRSRPAHPEGGEAPAVRAIAGALRHWIVSRPEKAS